MTLSRCGSRSTMKSPRAIPAGVLLAAGSTKLGRSEQTLVAETLVLAKTHGYVEKIEYELEEELQRENTELPNRILAKWRRNGENLLKNKYTLLTVALFCVTECALILGELILDLHKVKVVLEAQETDSKTFVEQLHKRYPDLIYPDQKITNIYDHILRSTIIWNDNLGTSNSSDDLDSETRHKRSTFPEQTIYVVPSEQTAVSNTLSNGTSATARTTGNGNHSHHGSSHEHSMEQNIAHAFHMASITILSILVFETFDLCIVMISFVVDLVCMQIMPRYKIQDFVFILAFLLPWRVIRVVNSLVVAVQDHEHFRLKLIYGRKKKIVNSLRESEIKLQLFRAQCNALKRLCFNEGVDEAKIDQILMVEECVVNKAGKSKCKIKIDNSSVILLNDKSDFPRLSPRPSLLSLVDKVGRRKSMQPPGGPMNDRELFLNTKESSKRGILKSRARSNSESGRGTLSSPEDAPGGQNSFGDYGGYSGLSTPIVINRKSSLNSPLMACHVRNILNSLEDKVNQMNGCYNRMGGGRGSIDTDSIAEETEGDVGVKGCSSRVDSIEEDTEGVGDCYSSGVSYASKRRASLQPQKCVDEDDCDLIGERKVNVTASYVATRNTNDVIGCDTFAGDNVSSVIGSNVLSPPFNSHRFIPTTIQIDPPSIHSNYSLSSSGSSNSNSSAHSFSTRQPSLSNRTTSGNDQSLYNASGQSSTRITDQCPAQVRGQSSTRIKDQNPAQVRGQSPTEVRNQNPTLVTGQSLTIAKRQSPTQIIDESHSQIIDQNHTQIMDQSPTLVKVESPTQVKVPSPTQIKCVAPDILHSLSIAPENSEPLLETSKTIQNETLNLETETPEQKLHDKPSQVAANMKPKTLRTPSDIENQNNLTFSESTDICESQSNDISPRSTSVDKFHEEFDKNGGILLMPQKSGQVKSMIQHQDISPMHENGHASKQISKAQKPSTPAASKGNIDSAGNASRSYAISVDDTMYPASTGSSVDPPECDLKRSPVPYFLN